jgi:hypothetical protein
MPQKMRKSVVIAIVAIVAVGALAGGLYVAYIISQPMNSQGGNLLINFASTGSGTKTTIITTAWGLTTPFPCSTCAVVNFSVSAPPGVTTGRFGLNVLDSSKNPISTAWVAIFWSPTGAPQAGYSSVTSTWVAATGTTLPIGNLSDGTLMLISTTSISGQGNNLVAFGTNGAEVSGSVNL